MASPSAGIFWLIKHGRHTEASLALDCPFFSFEVPKSRVWCNYQYFVDTSSFSWHINPCIYPMAPCSSVCLIYYTSLPRGVDKMAPPSSVCVCRYPYPEASIKWYLIVVYVPFSYISIFRAIDKLFTLVSVLFSYISMPTSVDQTAPHSSVRSVFHPSIPIL